MSQQLTPTERKQRVVELRKKHQPVFDSLGIPDAVYVPKMAHNVSGLEGHHMGFFKNELDHGEDVYTEKISNQWESEDPDRTLYRFRANPHFEEELPTSEPMQNGQRRYYVPVDELEIVEGKATKKAIAIPKDPDQGDVPMDQMTLRDYAAIKLGVPSSSKSWLNSMIEEANAKPF